MHDMEITWPDGTARFSPGDSPVRIGRSKSADVTLTHPSVSRLHLEVVWDRDHWSVTDHSTHGTFDPVGVRLTPHWTVGVDATVKLGGVGGDEITLRPVGVERLRRMPVEDPDDQTVIDLRPPPPPQPPEFGPDDALGGRDNADLTAGSADSRSAGASDARVLAPVAVGTAAETASVRAPQVADTDSEDSLHLNVDNRQFGFDEDQVITIGRDPACRVHLGERHSLVSRRHLQLYHQDGSWWMEDHSSKGTFVNGQQISSPYRVRGSVVALLGDAESGTPLRITTADEGAGRSYTLPLAIVGGLVLLALLTWLVMMLLGSSGSGADFGEAKRASAVLVSDSGVSSGFFVDDDLIVTDRRLATTGDQIYVGVTRSIDQPAQIEFVAEPVAAHPYLDLAVLKVTGRAEEAGGQPTVTDEVVGSTIVPVTIGASDAVTLGDEVDSVGVSEQSTAGDLLPQVTAVQGEATSFEIWPGCENPEWETFVPDNSPDGVTCAVDGDIRRGQMVAAMASNRSASGSPIYFDGDVVAVIVAGDDTPNRATAVTADSFKGWLDQVVAGN